MEGESNNHDGWIKVYRKLFKNPNDPIGSNGVTLGIWVWLLGNVVWKPTKARIRNRVVDLQRGELATSERMIGQALALSPATVRRHLGVLANNSSISLLREAHHTVVKVLKYTDYQDDKTASRNKTEALAKHLRSTCEAEAPSEPAPIKASKAPKNIRTKEEKNITPPISPSPGENGEKAEKPKRAKPGRVTSWEHSDPFAKVFEHLYAIPAYANIFDREADRKKLVEYQSRYTLSFAEMEQVAFDLRQWADNANRVIKSPRGTLNTFCRTAEETRNRKLAKNGPTALPAKPARPIIDRRDGRDAI